jgi:hypothetical protein
MSTSVKPAKPISIEPVELVLRVASATVGATEIPANTNSGPYVERVLALCGLSKGQPWCACEVANVGIAALGTSWPVPHTGGCQALYDWGSKKSIVKVMPQRGDIFLIWHPELGRFAHTGFIITQKLSGAWKTHEGNTSGSGSREGWIVAERERRFSDRDRFLRWADLL